MSTDAQTRIEALQQDLESTRETFITARELLDADDQTIQAYISQDQSSLESTPESSLLQKKFILDSFKINKAHKNYKDWERDCKKHLIENDVVQYNEILGKMSRVNLAINKAAAIYEKLSTSVTLPNFLISRKTLEKFNDESLIEVAKKSNKDGNDQLPRNVQLKQLFSLEASSTLPLPEFKVINQLINIEYRLRLEKRIQLELLTLIKQKLNSENREWAKNLDSLDRFITQSIPEAISQVERIKAQELDARSKKIEQESDSSDDEESEIQDVERDDDDMEHRREEVDVEDNEMGKESDVESDVQHSPIDTTSSPLPSDHHEDEEDLESHIHQEITAPDDSNTDNDEDEDMLLDH
ncbi:hypothetical protein MG7_06198 [Candida albicans P34048]|nr:hypothetical protein MG7_06198 [Candida albicans P34048]